MCRSHISRHTLLSVTAPATLLEFHRWLLNTLLWPVISAAHVGWTGSTRCNISFLTKCNAILEEACRHLRNKCDLNARSLCTCKHQGWRGRSTIIRTEVGNAGFSEAGFSEQITVLQISSHFICEIECLMETFNCEGSCCLFLNGYGFTVIIIFLRLAKIHHVTQRWKMEKTGLKSGHSVTQMSQQKSFCTAAAHSLSVVLRESLTDTEHLH